MFNVKFTRHNGFKNKVIDYQWKKNTISNIPDRYFNGLDD